MDSLDVLKRRLAQLRQQGMLGLNADVANLSPAARQLLAVLTRARPISPAPPPVRPPVVLPPPDPRDPPPPPPPPTDPRETDPM